MFIYWSKCLVHRQKERTKFTRTTREFCLNLHEQSQFPWTTGSLHDGWVNEEYVCFSCVGTGWVCKHVWPPQRSKWPLSWQSAPGPQAAAGSACPSRGPPGGGGRQRCRERTPTRGGPAEERWRLERLRGGKRRSVSEGWGGDLNALSCLILHSNAPLLSPISSLT